MAKLYCIASGEYDDFNIDFMFLNQDKRDEMLTKLNEEYYKYDRETSDEVDTSTIKNYYYAECNHWNIKFLKLNDLTDKLLINDDILCSADTIDETQLSYVRIPITKEDYLCKHKNKFRAEFRKLNKQFKALRKHKSVDEALEIIMGLE